MCLLWPVIIFYIYKLSNMLFMIVEKMKVGTIIIPFEVVKKLRHKLGLVIFPGNKSGC